jgi:hypothetical protein
MSKGEINTLLSTITLNINHLNSPNKRHRLPEWIKSNNNYWLVSKKLTSLAKTQAH